jgi:hypothetical protein
LMCGLEERAEDRLRLPADFPRGDIGLLELARAGVVAQFTPDATLRSRIFSRVATNR